jgi:hypothetical protein
MSERKCSKCGEKCLGHVGPTGDKCGLETESPRLTVEEKYDTLASQFSQLMFAVAGLTGKVDKLSAAKEPEIKQEKPESGGATGGEGFRLPPPSWNDIQGLPKDKAEAVTKTGIPEVGIEGVKDEHPSTLSLARDKELSRLLDDYNSAGLKDLLGAQESVNAALCPRQPSSSSGERTAPKALLIPDFLTNFDYTEEDEEDSFVTTKGKTFALQNQRKKLNIKEVSMSQWISANIVILEILFFHFFCN